MATYKHIISWSSFIFYSFLGFISLTAGVEQNNGIFSVVYAPKYVKFLSTASELNTEEIPSVILSTLGLPLSKDIAWNGLAEGSLFRRPKASVLISVLQEPNNAESFQPVTSQKSYSTSKADGFLDTDAVINQIQLENWKEEPFYLDFSSINLVPSIMSSAEGQFSSLPSSYISLRDSPLSVWFTAARLGSLSVANDPDLQLIGEIEAILSIVEALEAEPAVLRSRAPDFLHLSLSGLQTVLLHYGQNSAQAASAKHIVNDFITEITGRIRVLYKDSVVVEVVSLLPPSPEATLIRKSRSLLEDSSSNNKTDLNLAPAFTFMYAPIFNIILWTMIAFALAVFGIAWGMWNMDPGRDSLIYRMTSQRMKRD